MLPLVKKVRSRADTGHCCFAGLPYLRRMDAEPACCVGLAGDGDEIAAIECIEEAFRVALDDRDAPQWGTAGDVFASLLKALPPDAASDPATWERFAKALACESGIEPWRITTESPLLLPDTGLWGGFKEACVGVAFLWLVVLLLAIVF